MPVRSHNKIKKLLFTHLGLQKGAEIAVFMIGLIINNVSSFKGGKEECYWDCEVVIVENYPAVVRYIIDACNFPQNDN